MGYCRHEIISVITILLTQLASGRNVENVGQGLLKYYKEERLDIHPPRNSDETTQRTKLSFNLMKELDDRSSDIDYAKPTSQFLLGMFSNLRRGESLSEASGHLAGPLDAMDTDTIRCFASKGNIRQEALKASFGYHVPMLPLGERLMLAEFRIPRQEKVKHARKLKIIVKKGKYDIRSFIIRVKPYFSTDDQFEVFDISSSLGPWINGYHGNLTVRVLIRDKSMTRTSKGDPPNQDLDENRSSSKSLGQALLVFYSQNQAFLKTIYSSFTEEDGTEQPETVRHQRSLREPKRRRRKHNWGLSQSKKPKKLCRMHDFTVDFNSIGWGRWIIFPKRFNSYLCHGNCASPISSNLNPTNHAMMQSLMRQKRRSSAPAPCCVPTKLKPLSMLYYEFDEIVLRHHEDMIAEECGCR